MRTIHTNNKQRGLTMCVVCMCCRRVFIVKKEKEESENSAGGMIHYYTCFQHTTNVKDKKNYRAKCGVFSRVSSGFIRIK
jgi:hypothetical protein